MTSPEQNPFQSPASSSTALPNQEPTGKVAAVAKAQRLVNFAILCYICLIPLNMVSSVAASQANGDSILPLLIIPIFLGVLAFILFAVGKLAYALHGIGNAILYCLAMLIPCLGLILLVFLNARGSKYLKQHGVKIGLMGANLRTLPSSQKTP